MPPCSSLLEALRLVLTLCQVPVIQTDFDLDSTVPSAHELQDDMLLEEDAASIDLESTEAPTEGQATPGEDLVSDAQGEVESPDNRGPTPDQRADESVGLDPAGPRKPSKIALRRKRKRERSPDPKTKKQRMEEGRIRKAGKRTIQTNVVLETLTPGLNLNGREKKLYTREELEKEGIKVVPWDGV